VTANRGRPKKPRPSEPELDVFEQVGERLKKPALRQLSRLIKFGEPHAADEFIDPQVDEWVDAMEATDAGNKSHLVALLKRGTAVPESIIPHLGDLIERWEWRRPSHRPRVPSYLGRPERRQKARTINAAPSAVDPRIENWLDAIEAADSGDKSPLVVLLKRGTAVPGCILPHLGDLIERWEWRRPSHRMRVPSYLLTDDEIAMNAACVEVEELVAEGMTVEQAVADVAHRHNLNARTLAEYYAKRRSAERRVKARSYKQRAKPRPKPPPKPLP
jgi:hypothetical protein